MNAEQVGLIIAVFRRLLLTGQTDPAEIKAIEARLEALATTVVGEVANAATEAVKRGSTILSEMIAGHGNRPGTPESRAAARKAADEDDRD